MYHMCTSTSSKILNFSKRELMNKQRDELMNKGARERTEGQAIEQRDKQMTKCILVTRWPLSQPFSTRIKHERSPEGARSHGGVFGAQLHSKNGKNGKNIFMNITMLFRN